jgi:hypothetical protein
MPKIYYRQRRQQQLAIRHPIDFVAPMPRVSFNIRSHFAGLKKHRAMKETPFTRNDVVSLFSSFASNKEIYCMYSIRNIFSLIRAYQTERSRTP